MLAIAISEIERHKVDGFLKQHEIIEGKPLIVVHTMTRWETKLWDSPNFARLADQLINEYDAQIIFSGKKQDSPSIEKIISLMRWQAVNSSGETPSKSLPISSSVHSL